MSEIKDGGPAFPLQNADYTYAYGGHPGMSLRVYAAIQIAAGMAAFSGTQGSSYGPDDIATRSYEIADAMLAQRDKDGQP